MELYERNTCSFIVKVWVEKDDYKTDACLWRGHVTHVTSGKRQYFEELTKIVWFIKPYLVEMSEAIKRPG